MKNPDPPIRVLVVDDSFFMRQVVSRMIQENPDLEVVGTARDGGQAVEKNLELKPDVLTLDVEMPGLDGLGALERIFKSRPVAVVMLSAHTGTGMDTAVRALELGAVDCVGKPSGSLSLDIRKVQDELVENIRQAARIPRVLLGPRDPQAPPPRLPEKPSTRSRWPDPLLENRSPAVFAVAVASSTGGPRMLHELLARMPSAPPSCFLLIQHMAAGFTTALARRLSDSSPFPIVEAGEGDLLRDGVGYVAPGGKHLVVESGPRGMRTAFRDGPPRLGVKPSGDLLLSSVANTFGPRAIGLVMTGMGRDGAQGLLDMRKAGASTLAQDEASCVVYGMPKAAVENGAAAQVLPPVGLADEIRRILARQPLR